MTRDIGRDRGVTNFPISPRAISPAGCDWLQRNVRYQEDGLDAVVNRWFMPAI
jgi:hypothetical protein